MEFKVNHASSNTIVQAIRHSLLTEIAAVRPIAFCVGKDMTLVSAGNSVLEDTIEIAANLTLPLYCYSDSNFSPDFAVWHGTVDGTLSTSAFRSAGIEVADGKDVELLHTLTPVDVYVVFRYASGGYRNDDNRRFIDDICKDANKLDRSGAPKEQIAFLQEFRRLDGAFLHSRHCNIRNIKVSISDTDLDTNEDRVLIDFEYAGKFNPADILYEAVERLGSYMDHICNELSDHM